MPEAPRSMSTRRLTLRELDIGDVTGAYRDWLADPEINQFLETRFAEQTMESILEFVAEKSVSETEFLFGIFASGQHIGNIKIGPINPRHRVADVSYFIGERSAWGKGFATEAIGRVSRYGFEDLGLNKLSAGCYAPNIGSARALEKVGYKLEGVRRSHYFLNGAPVDLLDYGLLRTDLA